MADVSPNSAFFARTQDDALDIVELIEVALPGGQTMYWTTANGPITYTYSGVPTTYVPFPGVTPSGITETSDLSVSAVDFVLQNSGAPLQDMVANTDFGQAGLTIGRVFASTPDLGRMEVYNGQVGDFSYNRVQIKGQARNIWKSLNINWPYLTYQDTCGWRFGSPGCGFNTASVTFAVNSIQVGSSTTLDLLLKAGALSAFGPGDLDFGRLTVTAGVNSGHVRTIRAQTGDLVSLSNDLPFADFTAMQVSIYPGCRKRLVADCHSRYNNDKNFLGWPWILQQAGAY